MTYPAYAIDRHHDLALQIVHKAASKSILVALLADMGETVDSEVRRRPHRHPAFEMVETEAAVASGLRRAVFVRNPYARLVSCYAFFQLCLGRRKEVARPFADWLRWAMEDPQRDPHYAPMADAFRQPCFVGRVEDIETDWRHFRDWLGADLPALEHLNPSTHSDYRLYFTPRMRQTVETVYADDLEIFGYGF